MTFDEAEGRPPYRQIASELRKRILNNTYPPGTYLPSQTVLADEVFKVARMTVRSAIRILEDENLVQSIHGRGTLVVQRDESAAPTVEESPEDAILARLDDLQGEITGLSERIARLESQRSPGQ